MRAPSLQLLLDLFDEPPAPAAAVPPIATRPRPEQDLRPAEPLAQVLPPQVFSHPDANREIRLGDVLIAYEFRRARRKSIGFAVSPEGLTVSAPRWVPLGEVEQAVRGKSRWILAKLEQARERQSRLEAARIDWRDGASFPYLGEPVRVTLDPGHGFREVGGVLQADENGRVLRIGLPRTAQPAQIRDAVQAWMMRQARELFAQRLDYYAPQLGVQWRKLALSSAGTLWGTARADGTIRLNWRLVHFRLPVIDYVVAHELSHLRVMDHSPRFWETVRSVLPNYPELRGQLKQEPVPVW